MLKHMLALSFFVCGGSGLCAWSQSPLPVYDAVVIKPNTGVAPQTYSNLDDVSYQARNVPLKFLLVVAYGIRPGLMFGLPGWAGSMRFDVTAKVTQAEGKGLRGLSREQRQAMLAAVLEDRFHLRTHIEEKTLPVYELVAAKDGMKLTPSKVPLPEGADPQAYGSMNVHNTDLEATGVTMTDLAANLSAPLDRTVIDKTGLTGRYDFRLRWTADNVATPAEDAPPSIFTAIQEQLGLKLQAAKGPVKTLVIDHVEQPTEN